MLFTIDRSSISTTCSISIPRPSLTVPTGLTPIRQHFVRTGGGKHPCAG